MKPRYLLFIIVSVLVGLPKQTISQILPDPVFSYMPCILSPGNTVSATVYPVPGATGYIWSVDTNVINSVLFNGGLSPQYTQDTTMAITGVLAQLYYLICVTAVSPCCTSATVCDTVYSYAQYEFDSTNSSTALPNTSSTYSIHPLCLPPGNNMIIFWNTTGGIGINGTGDSSVTTGSSFPFVELNFGPGFTTGELCFYTVSNFGVPSVTNCMTINAPTSTMEPELYNPDIYFSSPDQSIIISMNHHITHSCKFEIIDITGKTHANGVIKAEGTKIEYQVPVINIPDGIYFIRLTTESNIQTQKLLITN